MPRKSQITVTARADGAKNAHAELARRNPALARRLAGSPFGAGNKALPLKEPGRWATYLENTYANDSAFIDMRAKGWEPMTADDLACAPSDVGFRVSVDGYLVRGKEGQEMLFKMTVEDHALMTDAKTAANMKGIGSRKKIQADIAEAASGQLGDEAADYLSNLPGQVVDRIVGGA